MPVPIALNFLQLNVGVDGVVEPEGVGGGGEIMILHPSDFVKIERFTYSKLQMCLVSCLVFGFQKHFELSIRNLVYQGHLI